MNISLSIIIKCYQDYRIFECLQSIDMTCEVIVPLAGNGTLGPDIQKRYPDVRIIPAPLRNLGASINLGIRESSCNAVVVMDSDAHFKPGSLALMIEHLKNNLVVKPRIVYEFESSIPGSRLVALTRQQFNDREVRALTPGLGFRKEVAVHIGGYYFDEDVRFTEDAAFDFRLKKAGVPIWFVPRAAVYHTPIPIWHDLRAGFRMGYGHRRAVEFAGRENDNRFRDVFRRLLYGHSFKAYCNDIISDGFDVATYRALWTLCYHSGFFKENLQISWRSA